MSNRIEIYAKCIFFLIFLISANCQTEDKCSTPDGQVGDCRDLASCQSIRSYLQALPRPWPPSVRGLLLKSHCGFEGKNPKICCPLRYQPIEETTANNFALTQSGFGASGNVGSDRRPSTTGLSNRRPPAPGLNDRRPPAPDLSDRRPPATGLGDRSPPAPGLADRGPASNSNVNVFISNRFRAPSPPEIDGHPNLKLISGKCGDVTDDRLIGGNKTGITEFPWMALISYRSPRGSLRFQCAGTIINQHYILTAAHCLKSLGETTLAGVRVGEHDIRTAVDCEGPPTRRVCSSGVQDFRISEAIPHPGYRGYIKNGLPRLQNDIGLIRISGTINFAYDNAQPICLPTTRELLEQDLTGMSVVVTGWGTTVATGGPQSPDLLQITIPVVSNEYCAKIHDRSTADGLSFRQLCAGGVKGVDSCGGDSGGPLQLTGLVRGTPSYVQYGIVSYGPTVCGMTDVPAVYTRVAYYMDWILDQMKP